MSGQMKDYTKLRELLEKETYPLEYLHKFIGRNTPAFSKSVSELEAKFSSRLKRQGSRKSSGDHHLALTYVFSADSADQVIEMLKATDIVFDLLMVL
ncbi:MAG: DUF493 family protein [Bdellovibrionota bacterium]